MTLSPVIERDVRVDPRTDEQWRKIAEAGSLVTIKSMTFASRRTVSYGTWVTWQKVPTTGHETSHGASNA